MQNLFLNQYLVFIYKISFLMVSFSCFCFISPFIIQKWSLCNIKWAYCDGEISWQVCSLTTCPRPTQQPWHRITIAFSSSSSRVSPPPCPHPCHTRSLRPGVNTRSTSLANTTACASTWSESSGNDALWELVWSESSGNDALWELVWYESSGNDALWELVWSESSGDDALWELVW